MKAGTVIFAAAGIAIISTLAIRAIHDRQPEPGFQRSADSTSLAVSRVQQPRSVATTPERAISGSASNAEIQDTSKNSSAAWPAEELQDPFARIALSFVGVDPEAEDYWFAAINDLSLPANERQDLIEDLNEEGLSDPQHPTIDDLPLIFNRLALIETIAPDAADQVNFDAFNEAYKDLLNLAELAMGGGEPVR
jgi:hypothetical protein